MEPFNLKHFVIAGINGKFGRIFARKLALAGASIHGIDVQASAADPSLCQTYSCCSITDMTAEALQAIADSDYVLLCLPEKVILQSLPRLCGIVKQNALLMDIASVKTKIADALSGLEINFGYLSIHPMFGPIEDFSGQSICLIPLYENPRCQYFEGITGQWGASIVKLTARQHDSLTALVQTLPHAALIAFGAALADGEISFDLLWTVSTPIQKILLALVARVVTGEHDTYWSIQSGNPFGAVAREKLEAEIRDLSALSLNLSLPEFSSKLDSVRRFLGPSDEALRKLAGECVGLLKSKP